MTNILLQHPIYSHAQEIADICKPLTLFNISYFCHVHIDKKNRCSAISNNPNYSKHYVQNQYYDADIHMALKHYVSRYFLWDLLEKSNKTLKLEQAASEFGIKHVFTIAESDQYGKDFYHFATHINSDAMNQVYLSNLDILKNFILYFKETVKNDKHLKKAHQFKHLLESNDLNDFSIKDQDIFPMPITRSQFLESLSSSHFQNNGSVFLHKGTRQPLTLAPQQSKCLQLLLQGYSSKEIAIKLNLSYRTVEHYLQRLRSMLGCRTSKEMIAAYAVAVNRLPTNIPC